MMGGFSAGIDAGNGDNNIMDHAACNQNLCHYNSIAQLTDPATGVRGDCVGGYCHGGNYNQYQDGWSSRFFVREAEPLDPEGDSVRVPPGRRLSTLSVSQRKSVLYGAFVWVRRALSSQKLVVGGPGSERRAGKNRRSRHAGTRRP
jgi:hypothetical protein